MTQIKPEHFTIHSPKTDLIAGWVCSIGFAVFLIMSLIVFSLDGPDWLSITICCLIWGIFLGIGIYTLLDARNHKLIIDGEQLTLVSVFGKRSTFHVTDIGRCISDEPQFLCIAPSLYDKDGHLICYINSKLTNARYLIPYLEHHSIPVITNAQKAKEEAGEQVKRMIQSRLQGQTSSVLETVPEISTAGIISHKSSFLSILINGLPICFYLLVLFTSQSVVQWLTILYPLFLIGWVLYTRPTDPKRFPHIGFGLSVLLAFLMTGPYTIVTLPRAIFVCAVLGTALAYIFISVYGLHQEKRLYVIFAVWLVIYLIPAAYLLNLRLHAEPVVHETVTVYALDDEIEYVTIRRMNEQLEDLDCSSHLYETLHTGDRISLCIHKSIFGVEIHDIHEIRE